MSSPVRLNHAVLFVSDLSRAERFYQEVFGMEIVAREPRARATFLRLPRSGNHHDLGLFGLGPQTQPKSGRAISLYHLAWQVDTIDELVGNLIMGRQKVYTGPTPTATSSRSCGCCQGTPGESMKTVHP